MWLIYLRLTAWPNCGNFSISRGNLWLSILLASVRCQIRNSFWTRSWLLLVFFSMFQLLVFSLLLLLLFLPLLLPRTQQSGHHLLLVLVVQHCPEARRAGNDRRLDFANVIEYLRDDKEEDKFSVTHCIKPLKVKSHALTHVNHVNVNHRERTKGHTRLHAFKLQIKQNDTYTKLTSNQIQSLGFFRNREQKRQLECFYRNCWRYIHSIAIRATTKDQYQVTMVSLRIADLPDRSPLDHRLPGYQEPYGGLCYEQVAEMKTRLPSRRYATKLASPECNRTAYNWSVLIASIRVRLNTRRNSVCICSFLCFAFVFVKHFLEIRHLKKNNIKGFVHNCSYTSYRYYYRPPVCWRILPYIVTPWTHFINYYKFIKDGIKLNYITMIIIISAAPHQ